MSPTADDYKARLRRTLIEAHKREYTNDLSHFPEDTQPILQKFCDLWYMKPPNRSDRSNSDYKDWIVGARSLLDACGEFGIEALEGYRAVFVEHMESHGGLAPFTVTRPASLVKVIRGYTAELRQPSFDKLSNKSIYGEEYG